MTGVRISPEMVHLSPEMVAAGVEAMQQARVECMTDGEVAIEIYLAMRGMEIKALCEQLETLH